MLRLSVLAMASLAVRWTAATDVFAHVMMSNTAQYGGITQWREDVKKAKQMGLDGFALNWTPTRCDKEWNNQYVLDNMALALRAAEEAGDFYIYHSLDMSQTECSGESFSPKYLYDIIKTQVKSKALYRVNTNVLVSTFDGNQEGTQYGSGWFSDFKTYMRDNGCAISLAPSFQSYDGQAKGDPEGAANSLVSDNQWIDGYKNWEGAWPSSGENITLDADQAFSSALKKAGKTGPYIMTVSPWWFRDGGIANEVKYGDNLLDNKLRAVADGSFQPDIIEVLTWNDWVESHYLMDLPDFKTKAEPAPDMVSSEPAVDYIIGHNHSPWRIILKYWLAAIKNGRNPAPTMDQVIFSYRLHSKDASCSEGSKPNGAENLEDAVFFWALVTEKSTISVTIDDIEYQRFEADASGPATFKLAFPQNLGGLGEEGRTPKVNILRNDETVAYGKGRMPIEAGCAKYDFNPIVNLAGEGENVGSDF